MTFDLNELEKHSSGICAILNWMHSASKAQNKFATTEIISADKYFPSMWWVCQNEYSSFCINNWFLVSFHFLEMEL
jgi:hypothetical protein